MITSIRRWGEGLALQLPEQIAANAGFEADCSVDVSVDNGKLVVTRLGKHEPTLEELVSLMTDDNRHGETDWGRPVGNEVW